MTIDIRKLIDYLLDTDVVQMSRDITGEELADWVMQVPFERQEYFRKHFKRMQNEFPVFLNGLDPERLQNFVDAVNRRVLPIYREVSADGK